MNSGVGSVRWHVSGIGAFDRFNYGDVLFANVLTHMIAQHLPEAELRYYALKAADMRLQGGVQTEPLRNLYRRSLGPDDRHLVVLTGGELLAPTWGQMAEHLVPATFSRQLKRLHRRTGHARWTGFWRRIYGCPNLQPWTIDPDDLKAPGQTAVVYNAVGGTSIEALSNKELSWQSAALKKAQWLSVRDNIVADGIVARGLPRPKVVPDSAVVMPSLLSHKDRETAREKAIRLSGLSQGGYICVQIAERWLRGHEEVLAEVLRQVNAQSGKAIMAFAIGRAAGHDDQVAARRLAARLGQKPWFGMVDADLTVNEIMGLIAGSDAYIGTSLHGFITAFSFSTPRVGLLPHLGKLIGFRDAWDLPDMPVGVDFADIPSALAFAMRADPATMAAKSKRAQDAYRSSFRDMIAQVTSVHSLNHTE